MVNRLLLLAHALRCSYLVRVDPGTLPPKESLDAVIDRHVRAINRGLTVVSGQYEGRLAVRDDYLTEEANRQEYFETIGRFVGVDPNIQVTGGPAFTSPVPGVPAIPFAPLLADGAPRSRRERPCLVSELL
jgi:hypothetical protein